MCKFISDLVRDSKAEGEQRGEQRGEQYKVIELVIKNHGKLSAKEAANLFAWSQSPVDEIYRILELEGENISAKEVREKLVKKGLISEVIMNS